MKQRTVGIFLVVVIYFALHVSMTWGGIRRFLNLPVHVADGKLIPAKIFFQSWSKGAERVAFFSYYIPVFSEIFEL
jgi:hypothetical protein